MDIDKFLLNKKLFSQPANKPSEVINQVEDSIDEDPIFKFFSPISQKAIQPRDFENQEAEVSNDSIKTESNKFKKMSFEERMKYYKEQYTKNNEIGVMEKLNSEHIECTFIPNIEKKSKQRTTEEFFKDQADFINKRKLKMKLLETKEKEKLNYKPQIITKRPSVTIEPKNLASKWKMHQAKAVETNISQKDKYNKSKTDLYIKHKLEKQLNEIYNLRDDKTGNIESVKKLSNNFVDTQNIGLILSSYGMVNIYSEGDIKLLEELWNILDCDSHNGLTIESLKNIVNAIMRLTPDSPPTTKSSIELPFMGRYIGSTFYLTQNESERFHEKFRVFYLNKMAAKRKEGIPEIYTHKPKLSENTIKIANKSKKRNPYQGKEEHDADVLKKKTQETFQLDKECTFKPQILNYRSNSKLREKR